MRAVLRPVRWVGSARVDLQAFAQPVRRDIGQALYAAQRGETYPTVKPLKGFGGGSVLEIVSSYATNTYRAVYTVRFEHAIYVLHAFQKKAKRGTKTTQKDIELIKRRLKRAERDHRRRQSDG